MIILKGKSKSSIGSGKEFESNFKLIGKNVIIEDGVRIFHPENITIEDNCYISHNSILNGYYKGEITIREDTWIGPNCFFHGAGGLEIGKAVGIGPSVQILTSSHVSKELNQPVIFNPLEFKKVKINNGADIGANSLLLPGVEIGIGTIIGAGCVVTKSIDSYAIAVGNPAKVIKYRVKWLL